LRFSAALRPFRVINLTRGEQVTNHLKKVLVIILARVNFPTERKIKEKFKNLNLGASIEVVFLYVSYSSEEVS
jgi:hypothetical protein